MVLSERGWTAIPVQDMMRVVLSAVFRGYDVGVRVESACGWYCRDIQAEEGEYVVGQRWMQSACGWRAGGCERAAVPQ